MIDVDDEIADLEIAQVGEKRLRGGAVPFGRPALFVEDVGFRVDLQAGGRQSKALGHAADGHEHRRVPRVVGPIDRNGEDLVFLEQLDGPFRPARGRRHEQRGLVFVTKRPDLGDPIPEASVHGQGGLTSHVRAGRVVDVRAAGSSASSSRPSVTSSVP